LLCLLALVGFGKAPTAIMLNDDNFEHETQAATGGSSGDWLILFYDTSFRQCREILNLWDDLATNLYAKINVAKVNL